MKHIQIAEATASDLCAIANIHKSAFKRQKESLQWIISNFSAYPRTIYYVAKQESKTLGYVQLTQKSGFRKDVVLEVEQIAIETTKRSQGIGSKLLQESIVLFNEKLAKENAFIKHILVTTRTDNKAQKLYKNILNVKQEHIIQNLYSSDEVILIARNVKL